MKKLLLLGAIALVATVSQASYLYWQVDMSDTASSFGIDTDRDYTFRFVQVYNDTKTTLDVYSYNTSTKSYQELSNPESIPSMTAETGHLFADVGTVTEGNADAYSYYIEVTGYSISGASGWQNQSEVITYANAVADGHIVDDLSAMAVMPTAWTGGTYMAPEPTSGLLLLVGASLLALKRRKV